MDSTRTHPFNLPWTVAAIGAGFYAGLAIWTAHLEIPFGGAFNVALSALSIIFAGLAFWMVARRIISPRVLALTNDAILFPKGFPITKIVPIHYAEIIRMSESEGKSNNSLHLTTSKKFIEINSGYFPDIKTYFAVRDFICTQASITLAPHEQRRGGIVHRWAVGPEPFISWIEPPEWVQYRSALYKSEPLFFRIGKALWIFVCCFFIITIPWLLLVMFKVPTATASSYLSLDLAVTFIYTLPIWLSIFYPVHATKMSLHKNGLTQFFGKQTNEINYDQLSGWAIIERQFHGFVIPILLLQINAQVREYALPDSNTRDKLVAIFHDREIFQVSELKPSWE